MQNGIALTPEQQLSLIEQYGGLDAWGTDAFEPHYAAAWAWAGNAPFQWGKQVRLPPRRHAQRDGRLLAASGSRTPAGCAPSSLTASTSGRRSSKRPASPSPRSSTGLRRSRWRGRASSTPSTTRTRAERHTVQYFEILGNRAIYKDGWWAACKLDRIPWEHRHRRWRGSHPERTTPSRTPGSCTTCPTTSARRTTSPPRTPRSSPS